eukprot:GHVT01080108.1.p2 GENE.GHVT01080108.1~~GHVT01080108.1.p2  ORF type:complete len:281 (-),score=41.96 GHVT01080108.1:3334-4176(-)
MAKTDYTDKPQMGIELFVGLMGLFIVLVAAWYMMFRKPLQPSQVPNTTSGPPRRGRGAMDRMMAPHPERGSVGGRAVGRPVEKPEPISTVEASSEDMEDADAVLLAKALRRKAEKDATKEEKRALQQQQQRELIECRTRKTEKAMSYEQRQRHKEQERKRQEEIERKKQAEKKKKEQGEYDLWKQQFAVEQQGVKESENAENEGKLLQKFVSYVMLHKVVPLDELASEFSLKTSVGLIKYRLIISRLNLVQSEKQHFSYRLHIIVVLACIRLCGALARRT